MTSYADLGWAVRIHAQCRRLEIVKDFAREVSVGITALSKSPEHSVIIFDPSWQRF